MHRSHARRLLAALTLTLTVAALLPGVAGAAPRAAVVPPAIPPTASWLQTFNYYRAMAGVPAVTENGSWSSGAAKHSKYMSVNGVLVHAEDPTKPEYSAEGDAAGRNGNVFSTTDLAVTERQIVEEWVQAPFHLVGMIDPRLRTTGYGRYQGYATLDVVRGLTGPPPSVPVTFPADGATTPLLSYDGNELPDPRTSCPGASGLPLAVLLPADVTVTATRITEFGQPVAHCWFDGNTYVNPDADAQAVGRSVLKGRRAIILMPTAALRAGSTYSASVATSSGAVNWTFHTAGPATTVVDPFVKAAYQDFLGRQPTATELLNARVSVAGSGDLSALARSLAGSSEWISVIVIGLYQSTLGRPPDAAGLSYWVGRIRNGLTVADTASLFYASDEYYARSGGTPEAWVGDLYSEILGRQADAAGKAYWAGLRRSGTPPSSIAYAFYQSIESRRKRVTDLYQALLGRAPDAGGLSYWAGQLLDGNDVQLAVNLASSAEYFARAGGRYP